MLKSETVGLRITSELTSPLPLFTNFLVQAFGIMIVAIITVSSSLRFLLKCFLRRQHSFVAGYMRITTLLSDCIDK